MWLVLYFPEMKDNYAGILHAIIKAAGDMRIELTGDIQSLSDALKGRMAEVRLLVMAPRDREDIQTLTAMGDIFCMVQHIIILPKRERRSIELSHLLRPRYISFLEDGPDDLCAVIRKILSRTNGTTAKDRKHKALR